MRKLKFYYFSAVLSVCTIVLITTRWQETPSKAVSPEVSPIVLPANGTSLQPITESPTNCNLKADPSKTITVVGMGGLGNLMCQYATLFAMTKNVSLPGAAVPSKMREKLLLAFSNLSLPETRVCEDRLSVLTLDSFYQNLSNSLIQVKETGVVMYDYLEELIFFHRYRNEIKQEFQFRPDLSSQAQSILHQFGHKGTFVGVHIRRTDYIAHLEWFNNGTVPDKKYYRQAMKKMRLQVANPIFLVVSDDKEWSTQHVVSASPNDTYWVGNASSREQDMATLVACNHSIISQGTFGFWSAYLAGGMTILPDHFSTKPYPLFDQAKTSKIPGWSFLDV